MFSHLFLCPVDIKLNNEKEVGTLEVFRLLTTKFLKKEKKSSTLLEKNKVRSAIENICKEYLVDFDDVLTFEALPNALDNTIAVITEKELNSKYEFIQEDETIFSVRLRELDII